MKYSGNFLEYMIKYIILFLLIASPVQAQGLAAGFDLKGGPLSVTADSLLIKQNDGWARFKGNVIAVQGKTKLTALEVQIWFDEKKGDSPASGSESIKKILALGNVEIITDDFTAKSDKAEFEAANETLILSGEKARLIRDKSRIIGKKIIWNQKKQQLTVDGAADKQGNNAEERIEMLIYPESGNSP